MVLRNMAEPTLTEIFGAGATQTATQLTVNKADLPGLTASATNTAESLLVGILLKAKEKLTTVSQDANIEQNLTVEESSFSETLIQRNNQTYRQKTLSVNLQKLDTSAGIDPDDY